MSVLPKIFASGPAPDLVIAFGTAGFPDVDTANGCVVIGPDNFLYNPYRDSSGTDPNPEHWDDQKLVETRLRSPSGASSIATFAIQPDLRLPIEARLLPSPLNPATPPFLLAATNYVALSEINITNYDDYTWTDAKAVTVCQTKVPDAPIGSVETTHGLIRLQSEAPFIFVSGITDRVGHFNSEVAPRSYAQNYVAAHNAGVATVWMFPLIEQPHATKV